MASRNYILALYKQMMRESQKFPDYNFRSYALRRVKDGFREGQKEGDQQRIAELVQKAQENLGIIKRQTVIGNLYGDNPSVIEDPRL